VNARPLQLPDDSLSDGVVTLRYWREDDVPALVAALQDPEVSRWLPLIPYPYTEEDARNSLRSYEEERNTGSGVYLAVTDAGTGNAQGSIGMSVDRHDLVANVGYWVKKEARRRGVATRGLRLLVRWAFQDLGLARVEIKTDVENVPSQRVAEKCGFLREGHLRSVWRTKYGRRDAYVYSLLSEDL
jgi:RimJ/RimL family protein N-acetyltransferase